MVTTTTARVRKRLCVFFSDDANARGQGRLERRGNALTEAEAEVEARRGARRECTERGRAIESGSKLLDCADARHTQKAYQRHEDKRRAAQAVSSSATQREREMDRKKRKNTTQPTSRVRSECLRVSD